MPAAVSLTYGDISRKLFLFECKVLSSQTSPTIFSCAGRTQMRSLLLLKETALCRSKACPSCSCSFQLCASPQSGSGPAWHTQGMNSLVVLAVFCALSHADRAGCSLSWGSAVPAASLGCSWDLSSELLLPKSCTAGGTNSSRVSERQSWAVKHGMHSSFPGSLHCVSITKSALLLSAVTSWPCKWGCCDKLCVKVWEVIFSSPPGIKHLVWVWQAKYFLTL